MSVHSEMIVTCDRCGARQQTWALSVDGARSVATKANWRRLTWPGRETPFDLCDVCAADLSGCAAFHGGENILSQYLDAPPGEDA